MDGSRPVKFARSTAAITALIHEYCFRLDAGDLDGVADLFANATMTSSSRPDRVLAGRDEIRRNYDGVMLYADGTPRTLHRITNTTIAFAGPDADAEADGDAGATAASARCYFEVLQHAPPDGPLASILAGEYRDRFVLAAGAWRFEHREIRPLFLGDLTRHMRPRP